ncbi:hypothetical protein G6F31_015885 [Rhizopus arrhizus]|nr:hypothetical protein G6F31_015885 [Rhizopus arrhizus]
MPSVSGLACGTSAPSTDHCLRFMASRAATTAARAGVSAVGGRPASTAGGTEMMGCVAWTAGCGWGLTAALRCCASTGAQAAVNRASSGSQRDMERTMGIPGAAGTPPS